MSPTFITIAAVVGGTVILLAVVVKIYNSLVNLKNRFENAFSQIEVQLQRRYDLIPNLVETVKGYMKHEKETLLNLPNLSTSPVSKGLIILNILNNTTPRRAIITTHLTISNIISISILYTSFVCTFK